MLIGKKLIRSTVARYLSINVTNRTINAGVTYTSPAVTLRPGEHGFLWHLYFMCEDANNLNRFNVLVNGAAVFEDHLCFPKYPGTQQGETRDQWNMYFPPNSDIQITLQNNGIDADIFWGCLIIYRFYDKDLEFEVDAPECPRWLVEPPDWLLQALGIAPNAVK